MKSDPMSSSNQLTCAVFGATGRFERRKKEEGDRRVSEATLSSFVRIEQT
jgi:hypothetical protein